MYYQTYNNVRVAQRISLSCLSAIFVSTVKRRKEEHSFKHDGTELTSAGQLGSNNHANRSSELNQNHEYQTPNNEPKRPLDDGAFTNPSYSGLSTEYDNPGLSTEYDNPDKPGEGNDYEEIKENSAAKEDQYQQLKSNPSTDYEGLNTDYIEIVGTS